MLTFLPSSLSLQFLMALRNNTMREFEYMRTNAALNYGAFEHWQHEYKFLPNMTRPSSLVSASIDSKPDCN